MKFVLAACHEDTNEDSTKTVSMNSEIVKGNGKTKQKHLFLVVSNLKVLDQITLENNVVLTLRLGKFSFK